MHFYQFLCGYSVDGYTIHEYLEDYHVGDSRPVISYCVFRGSCLDFLCHDYGTAIDFIERM